jgi:hypothetical protein
MNMKSNTLTVLGFLAAIVAFVALPVSAPAAAVAFTATGVLSILVADYGRSIEPVRVTAEVVPFQSSRRTPAGLDRAA